MKIIESKTYLVGFRFKDDKTISTYKAVEGNDIYEAMSVAKEYANKTRYVIATIKENDIPTLRSSTKTISIDV